MRLGIPIWRDQVSPVFDVASRLLVLDIAHGRETGRQIVQLGAMDEASRTRRLAALGVDLLICGAITRTLEDRVTAAGVEVVSLVTGPIERVAGFMVAERPLPAECLLPGHQQPRVRGGNHARHGRGSSHPG